MSALRRIEAFRSNGARSNEPVTPEGKQRSDANSWKHGLTAKTLVLSNEETERFNQVFDGYVAELDPPSGLQMDLIEDMVAAKWRQRRCWAIETSTIDHQMDVQEPELALKYDRLDQPTRLCLAFQALAEQKALNTLNRYENGYRRQFYKALETLLKLRSPGKNRILRNEPSAGIEHSESDLPAGPAVDDRITMATEPRPMSQPHREITHVSDTALMVAAARALETEAPDGFVNDPFAARLAGDRGITILRSIPRSEMMRFGIGIRSRLMDDVLLDALKSNSIGTVVSLGCGLDTRPWRLHLPSDLRWIEVDFADMLDYKDSIMSKETPHCRRERLAADVNDPPQRRAIYEAARPGPALMITEGLLMYLPAATVEALAIETAAQSGITHWMSDIVTSTFEKAINMNTDQTVGHVQAADFLHGEQVIDCVLSHGWVTAARRSYITDVPFALERGMRLVGASGPPSGPPPAVIDDPTGIHLFARP